MATKKPESGIALQTTWNTGAHYSEHGQRIAAAWVKGPDGVSSIVFNDIDRGIWGEIPLALGAYVGDVFKLRDLATANYNLGNYNHPSAPDAYLVLNGLGNLAAGKTVFK
jgi:hypothetical protein